MKSSGLYIHVPFCKKKCSYCSFYSVKSNERTRFSFGKALLSELEQRVRDNSIGTIYAGGGTPTLLPPEFWGEFLTLVDDIADTSEIHECTIETNPGAVTERDLFTLRQIGFNRLSIGVQSFSDVALETLGRIHNSTRAVETFRSARKAGFGNISIDLMYGIPKQTFKEWLEDLKRIEDLAPEHISCYELSVEEGTPIAEAINAGELFKPEEETCREMYFTADEILKESGYFHYEVSNYARGKSFISRHNSAYWDRTPYIGLGPSAHSFNGKNTRSWNVASIEEYLRRMKSGKSSVAGREEIACEQVALEAVMLGLRCSIGFDLEKIETETGVSINRDHLNAMIENNRVILSGSEYVPTVEGMLYADGDSINLVG